MPQKLGQHFLVNPEIARTIVNALDVKLQDRILEIGPGKGFLTEYLMDFPVPITAVELDKGLFEKLLEKYNSSNLKLINDDFLKIDIEALDFNKICANVPYYIAGKIIEKILLSEHKWSLCILMLPTSLANRVLAKEGTSDFASISVATLASCRTSLVTRVSKTDFAPEPEIESSVVMFERQSLEYASSSFYSFVKASFSNRRKKIKNSLSRAYCISINKLEPILLRVGISPDLRPQDVSADLYKDLFEEFVKEKIL